MNGDKTEPLMKVEREYRVYTVRLSRGMGGDSAGVEFTREERKNFVQAEFSFRSFSPAVLRVRNLLFSDIDLSNTREEKKGQTRARTDIQLPNTSK
jgi:hypothetical protein